MIKNIVHRVLSLSAKVNAMKTALQLLISFFLCLSFGGSRLTAQQADVGSLIEGARMAWSPAQTGVHNYVQATAIYRQQWLGFAGAPQRLGLYAQLPFTKLNTGLGIVLEQQEAGPFKQTDVQLNYAYRMPVGTGRLSLGISGQFGAFTYDPADQVLAEANDPLVAGERINTTVFNVGGGIYYLSVDAEDYLDQHFFAGLGVRQALPADLMFGDDSGAGNLRRVLHGFAIAGYRFDWQDAFLEPSAQLDYAQHNLFLPRLNLTYELHEAFWAGIAMDGTFALSGQAGFIFGDGSEWQGRVGLFASRNTNPTGIDAGTTVGATATWRYFR